ncbi:MAG: helix-turn-helix domain-containing protein [Eubacteriales bacterium]|nr:helix-turn-helix domain-containing protein [Eubacteriales bacterium]
MKEKKYSISEASRILEVENHVLRYWEEELELVIPRNELGHRYYREEELQLLNCIKELKNKGFQLKAVKEVLPDLAQKRLIDVHKLLARQVELENLGIGEEEDFEPQRIEEREEESLKEDDEEKEEVSYEEVEKKMHPAEMKQQEIRFRSKEEKMREFEAIMGRIVGKALREQAEDLEEALGNRVSSRVIREMDDMLGEQEEREEARFKKLDEAIRSHQKARQEIAVAKDGGRKKSLFFRKNNRKI